MKKLIFLLTFFLSFSSLVRAQWVQSGTNMIYNSGNVGIGTTAPTSLLTLNSATGAAVVWQKGGSNIAALSVDGTSSTWNGGGSIGLNLVATNADINMQTGTPAITSLIIKNNGNVGIGTLDTKGYKLAVNGSAIATSVTVKSAGNWPDYVFKKDYHLPSLQEVKAYIDQNQHLPEIPSEQQIDIEGLNLGEMNKLLMKKVEELTLYLIEKDKEGKEQKAINTDQQSEINLLKQQVASLLKPKNTSN